MTTEHETQTERLLSWAQRGYRIDQVHWAINPPDGGKPIWRVAAAIHALERRGHIFERISLGGSRVEYRLTHTPPTQHPVPEPDRLIDVKPKSGNAIHGPGWDA